MESNMNGEEKQAGAKAVERTVTGASRRTGLWALACAAAAAFTLVMCVLQLSCTWPTPWRIERSDVVVGVFAVLALVCLLTAMVAVTALAALVRVRSRAPEQVLRTYRFCVALTGDAALVMLVVFAFGVLIAEKTRIIDVLALALSALATAALKLPAALSRRISSSRVFFIAATLCIEVSVVLSIHTSSGSFLDVVLCAHQALLFASITAGLLYRCGKSAYSALLDGAASL